MARDEKRLTRSVRLRKYESVYKKYVHKKETREKPRVRRIRHTEHTEAKEPIVKKEQKKKPLTNYQKFVRSENKKSKYSNMRGSERLSAIAAEWDKYKRKISKKRCK